MELDLRRLRYFLAVVEHGSFTVAATHNHVSQQAVSSAVARLERGFGVALFLRTPGSIRVTPAGAALARHARQLLESADVATAELQRLASAAAESPAFLRISCVFDTPGYVKPLLARLVHRFPELRLQASVTSELAATEDVLTGRSDAAIVWECPVVGSGITRHPITDLPMVAVVRQDDPLAGASEFELPHPMGRPLVLFDRDLAPAPWDRLVHAVHGSRAEEKLICRTTVIDGSSPARLAAVARGDGVTLVCAAAAPRLPQVVRAIPVRPSLKLRIHLLLPDEPSPAALALLAQTRTAA